MANQDFRYQAAIINISMKLVFGPVPELEALHASHEALHICSSIYLITQQHFSTRNYLTTARYLIIPEELFRLLYAVRRLI